jgi:hypothetical protein
MRFFENELEKKRNFIPGITRSFLEIFITHLNQKTFGAVWKYY